jgi:hypothetical protein
MSTSKPKPQAKRAQEPTGWPNSLADRPVFKVVHPETWLPCIYTRRRSPSQWRMLVEAAPPGRPATTWSQTDLSKSVEELFTPINTPLTVRVDTHTTLWRFYLQSSHS